MSLFIINRSLLLIIFLTGVLFISYSCEKKGNKSVNFIFNPDSIPSIASDSVTILISDSGMVRYKLKAEIWDMYDQAKDPYWYFPKGIYVEQFDTAFNIIVVIKADTAWNFIRKNLWRLRGNVFVKNKIGETFISEELFWDRDKKKIYSDKFVEINRPEKGILPAEGGFEMNEQMTEYKFLRTKGGQFFIREEDPSMNNSQSDDEKTE